MGRVADILGEVHATSIFRVKVCEVGEFLYIYIYIYIYMFILREPLGCREHWPPIWSDGNWKVAGRLPPTVNPYRQITYFKIWQLGFNLVSLHLSFVADKVAQQVFLSLSSVFSR
jgi:hypothetical protein